MSSHVAHHPYASVLRQRAARLQELAQAIERSLVMALDDEPMLAAVPLHSRRARLCEALLARNLHQLHAAADELRDTAFRFLTRAEEFDRAHLAVARSTHPSGEAA